ncbi:MAG: hypothetical protein Fur0022_02150 [Anaerolineales bacterium]
MQAQLNISKNLLPKIPQFWETPGTAFAELVQNAWRAGATEIHLQVDADAEILTIRDNGRGIQALDDFLTIGQSDWERTVTEPAGMGFYAHFGYCQQTVVESRGIRYTFTPACLSGSPVEVVPCPDTGWTVIRVMGASHLQEIAWNQMRPLPAPEQDITFTVNGQAIPNPQATMTRLVTPVGLAYLRWQDSPSTFPPGIWEGLPVGYSYQVHPSYSTHGQEYIWDVDPACGVRPCLPGREHLIQDAAYTQALTILNQEIETFCETRAREVDLHSLPEALDWRKHALVEALTAVGLNEVVIQQWVQAHLYSPVEIFEGQWALEEGYPDYPLTEHVSIRLDKVLRFRLPNAEDQDGEVVAVLLNNQKGRWKNWNFCQGEHETVAFVYDETGEALTLPGLRIHGQGWIADKIQLGEHLVMEPPGLCFMKGEPVWIGDAADILEHAETFLELWAFCEHHREYGLLGELVGSHNEFEVGLLQRQLAERYALGEDINLRNWLRATRQNMRWEIPRKYLPCFERALETAERQARKRGYTLAEAKPTPGGVP